MNLKCYELQSYDMWLGLPIRAYFKTMKSANEYFESNCIGTGIICKVRLEADGKFTNGCTPFNPKVTILGVHE